MTDLPRAPLKRILKQAGSERVSDDAVTSFEQAVLDYAQDLADSARQYARHAGRKTVKKNDVRAVLK